VAGSAAPVLGNATANASGMHLLPIIGSAAPLLAPATASANGTSFMPIYGTVSVTLSNFQSLVVAMSLLGVVKFYLWNGSAFVARDVLTWNGTEWLPPLALSMWDGNTFVDITST
jgi:hypothetical protein